MFPDDATVGRLIGYWAHALQHVAKILARVGIHVVTDTEDADDLHQSLLVALDAIGGRAVDDETKSAIFTLTLRWLVVGDLIATYRQNGEEWRIAAVLDALNQVEALAVIATGLLDERDAAN